jgi:drug/metabolite transporter (DMT)-like permease
MLFSGFVLVSRSGLATDIALADLAALRFGIAGVLLAPVVLRHGLSGLTWRQGLLIAFLGGLGSALSAYAGFSLAPAAHGSVLFHGTLPLTTFMIVLVTVGKPVVRGRWAGIALISAGVVAMAWDSVTVANARQLFGDGFLLLASTCWSAYGIVISRLTLAPIRAAAIVAVLSASCFLPVYALCADGALLTVGWRDIVGQGVFQGVLIGTCSIFLYTRTVTALGAPEVSLFIAAVPCVTTLAAIPVLSEWPTPMAIVGVVGVTVGMIVAVRATRMRESDA